MVILEKLIILFHIIDLLRKELLPGLVRNSLRANFDVNVTDNMTGVRMMITDRKQEHNKVNFQNVYYDFCFLQCLYTMTMEVIMELIRYLVI